MFPTSRAQAAFEDLPSRMKVHHGDAETRRRGSRKSEIGDMHVDWLWTRLHGSPISDLRERCVGGEAAFVRRGGLRRANRGGGFSLNHPLDSLLQHGNIENDLLREFRFLHVLASPLPPPNTVGRIQRARGAPAGFCQPLLRGESLFRMGRYCSAVSLSAAPSGS